MAGGRRRIFRFRRTAAFERRVVLAALVLGGISWGASYFVHQTPDIPECASEPAKLQVARSLSNDAPTHAEGITVGRTWEKDSVGGKLVLKPGDSRHCAAVAEVDGRQPQVIRYNIVPDSAPPGYRVAIFQHRLQQQ